jgi:glycosyltransferase involved in cell wall biosynthesis
MGIFDRQRLVLNKSTKIIATSEKMKRELSTLIDESKIDVLGSVSRFPTRKVKRESGKGFVFLGRFAPEKGIKELVLSWPKSENLTLIGQGDIDRAVRETIDKKSIKVRSAEFTNSSDFLDEFEGLVFPSTWLEGSPLVIYEALSISLPVICNSISSASEIFAQSQAGVVIENFSSQAVIQDGINELRTNYNFRQEECLRLSMGKLSRESWGIKLEQILMDSAY